LLLFLAGASSPLWIRKERTREFLARIFLWFVLAGCIVFGGIIIWTGLHDYFSGSTESQWKIMLAVFAVILVGAGSNILYEFFIKRRMELLEMQRLRQRYPESPWKWSRRWRSNTIEYSDKSEMIFSYLITSLMLTGMTLGYFMRKEEILKSFEENRTDSLVILSMLVIGTLFVVRHAVTSTIRWRKFRRSSFVMTTFPGVVGGKLEGEIQTRSKHVPCHGFDLKLSCIEMDITFRKSFHSIEETVLWESEKKVRVESMRMGPGGISFPVSFTIPATTEETDTLSHERRVYWLLTAQCSGDEHGLTVAFKVPVFRVTKDHALNNHHVSRD
jgi:ABC-type multidrug transport system fused ATPase/permease subunit